MKFRKKPVIIEAYHYLGDGFEALGWAGSISDGNGTHLVLALGEGLRIRTLESIMEVSEGDWIICGVNGEFYPCKPDIFEKTYEPVEDVEKLREAFHAFIIEFDEHGKTGKTRPGFKESYDRAKSALAEDDKESCQHQFGHLENEAFEHCRLCGERGEPAAKEAGE